jgi:hypothetical protein
MLSFTGHVGIRDPHFGQQRTFKVFHDLGFIIADVIVSEKMPNAVHHQV